MRVAAILSIPATHPALPGHFPDAPVVPGALLLDRVIDLVEQDMARAVTEVLWAKFHRPLLPDRDLHVTVTPEARGETVSFACEIDGASVVDGRLRLGPGLTS